MRASGAKLVKRRFFLFWHHGCSVARNSPACKGKSLRCLRKCRFSYIDTSPALSARRHLRAALRYSACPPHRPSCLDLGCQTHQTWCAPTSWSCLQIGRLFKLFAVNYGCNRKSPLVHGTPRGGGGTECEAVRRGRAGCEGAGRLRCDLARLRAIGRPACHHRSAAVEQAVADTAERAADLAKTRQRRRNARASNHPHSDLSVPPPSRVRSRL